MRFHNKIGIVVLCLISVVISTISFSSGAEMGDLMKKVVIAGDDFFEWFAKGTYNSKENEFILFYRISGFLDPDKAETLMSGINGRRVSYAGEVLGDPISSITVPGTETQAWGMPACNPFKNEYMVSFVQGQKGTGWDLLARILDAQGNSLSEKIAISVLPAAQTMHPFIVFNPQRNVYFITWNDDRNGEEDIFGIMLREDGSIDTDEFLVCDAKGDQIFTDMALNTQDGSCFVTWEDFRHVDNWQEPSDIYGAIVSATGEVLKKNIPVCDDFGMENEGDQRRQRQTYDSKTNSFFVVWWDKTTTLDGGIYARIISASGEPQGETFQFIDGPNPQINCSVSYHEKTDRIFAAWDDMRDADLDSEEETERKKTDIYARWFYTNGEPDGPEIPIEIQVGEQANPKIIYNSLMDRFLISWRNQNVEEEGGGGGNIGDGHIAESAGNVEGMLYGIPSFVAGRVMDKETGAPMEETSVVILGIGTFSSVKTSAGGWFHLLEENQARGWYLLMVLKKGYLPYLNLINYQGSSLDKTIHLQSSFF